MEHTVQQGLSRDNTEEDKISRFIILALEKRRREASFVPLHEIPTSLFWVHKGNFGKWPRALNMARTEICP